MHFRNCHSYQGREANFEKKKKKTIFLLENEHFWPGAFQKGPPFFGFDWAASRRRHLALQALIFLIQNLTMISQVYPSKSEVYQVLLTYYRLPISHYFT